MKRKLILLGGTFAVVLLAIVAFHLLGPAIPYDLLSGTDDDLRDGLEPSKGDGVTRPDSKHGTFFKFIETEPYAAGARVKRVYRVREWYKRDDGVYVLTRPEVMLFQKDGQEIAITSKSGEVVVEWIEGKPRVISGFLEGDVKIFIDRAKDHRRREALPPEQRPEVVRIYTEKLHFSNPDLEIYTDRNITLFSKEGDIIGRGLRLSWSESPRELRYLKIEHGQQMIVHNAGERSPVLMMPGQQTDAAGGEPAVVASAGGVKPTDGADSRPGAAPKPDEAQGMRSNVFVANFFAGKQNVYVHSGDRRMRGARKLSLTFEFEPPRSDGSSSEAAPPPVAPVGPVDPGTVPRDVPDAPPARPIPLPDADVDASPASQPVTRPSTRPASATQPAAPKAEPLIIEWDGPLVLSPKGHTPIPSRKRYNIVATGKTVTLSDKESTASCEKFTYDNLSQVGELKGRDDRPAELLTAQREKVVSKVIGFDRAKGQATLSGKGYMIRQIAQVVPDREAPTSRPATQPATQPATHPATQPATQPADHPDRIDWSESVLALFGTEQRVVDGKVSKRQYIKETTFRGDVKLKQGQTGDFVNCDKLHVWMSRTSSGSVQPQKAIATGNAYARQEGSDIRADEITVTFKEAPRPAGARTENDERVSRRVKPSTLLAVGNVKVNDKRGKEPVTAAADRLESNIIDRTAVLTGAMARLTQGPNTLAGRKIELRQERLTFKKPGQGDVIETRQYARVIGQGNMKFMTDKDMSGRSLSKSRPIRITWTKSMDYHPKEVAGGVAREHSAADFKGDVTVDSGDDHMECQDMEALFAEPTRRPTGAPTTAPAAPVPLEGGKSAGPVTMANYSQRKLIRLTADEKVVLASRRLDTNDALLRRIHLEGPHLVYNTVSGIVNMDKSGRMIAEDYRKPLPKAPADAGDTQSIERPMLTVFQWKDSMELSQKERVVIMKGKVAMVHRSGAFVLPMIKDLKVPDYGKNVPPGRKTNLRCDEMLARFDPPKVIKATTTQPATRPADPFDVGPKVGALKFFNATGNVNLTDGNKQVVGQRLIYSRTKELLQVFGYLPNQPKADALIIDKDPKKSTEKVVKSPRILWYRATKANGYKEKIEAEAVSVD
ncbi:MAG: LPS export ABC transporter periplasmic protein LptC [Phycisphaerae bacterium]|nr:LPS export ABC transporter periplasmic protein LptC [Phycisphaerae bacterium]